MSTHDIQSLLSDNEGSSDDEKDTTTPMVDDQYYHHESGPFDKKDGSYRHRNPSSPKHLSATVKTPKLSYSWSTPDFSLYSQPLKSSKNAKKVPSPKYKPLKSYEYQQVLRDIIRADVPIIPKSFILCPVPSISINNHKFISIKSIISSISIIAFKTRS